MFTGFDAKWIEALGKHIEVLERRFLEVMEPDEIDIADLFDGRSFFAIQGLADFWSTHPGMDFEQSITDLVISTHSQRQSSLVFVLAGSSQKLSVYISLGNEAATKAILKGIIPGIHLNPVPVTNLVHLLKNHFFVKGVISGIPNRKATGQGSGTQKADTSGGGSKTADHGTTETQNMSQFERVVRGMHDATWAYVIHASPRPRHKVAEDRLKVIDQLADITSQSRISLQATKQESMQITVVNTGTNTETLSGEMVNYRAQYLTRLMERQLERLDESIAAGQWLVGSYFGASKADDAQRLASLLMGTLAGKDSRPEPLRAFLCRRGGRYLTDFETLLSSAEVAALIQFPREEVPGYAISDFVRFDVDFHLSQATSARGVLELGHIQQNGEDTHDAYRIQLNDLAKHGVVVGVTGSGKTTTVMNLLDRIVDAKMPFLVIEPAKTEYRALRSALVGRAELRVYTLGNENIAPFRLNPFEFETDDVPGSASVVNHIDFLKAVFNAAFILYAPMPYVLETALHEVYEDKGWDLATGLNSRLPKWADRQLHPIFPTLTDLYRKVETVVDRLGYDTRIEQDVKAGLKARIGSMRIGSKGLMLDTARGIPMSQLLSYPTILEMENIGGDDEKTFLMGLLLARLYEYRRLQAASGKLSSNLQHLIVFEEAHRLLKNTETQVDSESSNMRSQAIEVFTNMLSEVRAYGQGVIVAEQIPSKLAPDVLKNTNLKIVHRLIAQDDRESVGQTMNLKTDQITHLGILAPGMAAVYAEGADHAYLVRLDDYKGKLTPVSDARLKQDSPGYASVEPWLGIVDLQRYGVQRSAFGGPEASTYQSAARLLDAKRGPWLWASLLIRTVFSRSQVPQVLDMLRRQIVDELPSLQTTNQREATLRMTIVRGCAEVLHNRGAMFGWTYPTIEDLRLSLTRGFITFLQTNDLLLASSELDRFARKYEQLMEREHGPFAGCRHCRAKCVYRLDVRDLISAVDKSWIDGNLTNPTYPTRKDRYAAIAKTAKEIAEQWLATTNFVVSDVGYCGALHIAASLDLTEYEQAYFGDWLKPELLK